MSFLWLIIVLIARTDASENNTDLPDVCKAGFRYFNTKETVNFVSCRGKCIVKCCPEKQILLRENNATEGSTTTSCVEGDYLMEQYKIIDPNNYSKANIDIYSSKDYKTKPLKTEKKLSNFIFIFSERFLYTECTLNLMEYFPPEDHYNYYLLEDGSMSTWSPNELNPWSDYGAYEFCVDHQVTLNKGGALVSPIPEVSFLALVTLADDSDSQVQYTLRVYGMLISCFFLALTLWVYTVLPDIRNLPGKMTMALVSALLASFLCRCILYFGSLSKTTCSVFSILLIYFLLLSFAWMNVLSYSMSRTMRPLANSFRLSERQQNNKFLQYCLFAFGIPLIEIVFIIVVEHLDLTDVPAFVKPRIIYNIKRCFLDDDERRLYLNIPITIAVATNTCLFLRSVYAYFETKRAINNNMPADSRKNQGNKTKNILIVVKLSVIMGITWIFEVISSEVGWDSPVMTVFDVYNTLSGLAIFILFICKKKNLKELSKKFKIFRPLARRCGITDFTDEHDFETALTDIGYRPSTRSVRK